MNTNETQQMFQTAFLKASDGETYAVVIKRRVAYIHEGQNGWAYIAYWLGGPSNYETVQFFSPIDYRN